jgi:hypothetical protein
MVKRFFFLFTFVTGISVEAGLPCPSPPRHVANNGFYFELGGGSVFASAGYSGVLNVGWSSHVVLSTGVVASPAFIAIEQCRGLTTALEFHESFYENSIYLWTVGCAFTSVYESAKLNGESFKNADKENYIAPMIGLELLLWNRFSTELKFQPHYFYGPNGQGINAWFGFKTKIQFGRAANSEMIGVYR